MLEDPHQHKRPTVENCESCRFYFPTPKGDNGNCHRFPPPSATSGHVTVYPRGWCGEYELDSVKIDELGKEHFKIRIEQNKARAQQHKVIGDKLRSESPNPQATIAKNPVR